MDMFEEEFAIRLARLRTKKGVSARDMSLSIGQNPGYINYIENGKSMPSMSAFFFICDYLNITPREFFDTDAEQPEKLNELIADLKRLSDRQLECVAEIVRGLVR